MNRIVIKSPRWHDRVVLIANHKIGTDNEIVIEHSDFPQPFYLSGERARTYPTEQLKAKAGGTMTVRAVPLHELENEVINV